MRQIATLFATAGFLVTPDCAIAQFRLTGSTGNVFLTVRADDGEEFLEESPSFTEESGTDEQEILYQQTFEGPTTAGNSSVFWNGAISTNVLFNNFASGRVQGQIAISKGIGEGSGTAIGRSEFAADFTIDDGPADFGYQVQLLANGAAANSDEAARTAFVLQRSGATVVEHVVVSDLDDERTEAEQVDSSGTLLLSPGTYRLILEADVDADDTAIGGSYVASFNVSFGLSPGMEEASEVFWQANHGNYDDAENWEPQQVPGAAQTAIFDRDATYTVTIDAAETGRARLVRGFVGWDATTYTLSSGDIVSPSLIVGESSADIASLDLLNSDLNTIHATIGQGPSTNGIVRSSNTGRWTNQGRLTIGEEGMGTLTIENDARLTTGELRLGDLAGSDGRLEVYDGVVLAAPQAKQDGEPSVIAGATAIGRIGIGEIIVRDSLVETGQTELGALPGGVGEITFESATAPTFWDLAGNLIVGNEGTGSVTIAAGSTLRSKPGTMTNAVIAAETFSIGTIHLDGILASLFISGDLVVGPGGDGLLMAENGAQVSAGFMDIGPLSPTEDEDNRGDVMLQGEGQIPAEPGLPMLDVATILSVGNSGPATLTATSGAEIRSASATIGLNEGGAGHVTLADSRWIVDGTLGIGPTDESSGMGILTLAEGEVRTDSLLIAPGSRIDGIGLAVCISGATIEGEVSPGILTVGFKTPPAARLLDKPIQLKGLPESDPVGTLTMDGDATFTGATLTIDASGPGKFDTIEITGNADLTSTTITFNFIEGYLPQTGDELPFVLTDGTLTIDENTNLQYSGAAEGFEFDINAENGMLMFAAQNNAQPEGGEGEGEGEGSNEGTGETPVGCSATKVAGNSSPLSFPLAFLLILFLVTHRFEKFFAMAA